MKKLSLERKFLHNAQALKIKLLTWI